MSEKTREELKEQIKIMNHNYQVIKEMHERGYKYSVGEIKRLQAELERTRKALDVAVNYLQDQLSSFDGIKDDKIAKDIRTLLEQINEIKKG